MATTVATTAAAATAATGAQRRCGLLADECKGLVQSTFGEAHAGVSWWSRHLPWQTIGDSDILTVLHCFWGGEFFLTLILLPKPVLDLTSSQYRVLFYHLYTALHERHNLGVGHVWVSNGQQYSNTASLRCA